MKSLGQIVLGSCVVASVVAAADETEWTPGLAGELGGLRRSWNDAGVAPFLNYTLDGLAVLGGGFGRGESLQGVAEFGVEFDLARQLGWAGTRLHLHGLYFHGDDPSAELVGDAMYLSNIVARGGLRLFEVWADHQRGDWNFKAGVIAADSDFGNSEAATLFVNSAFGPLPSYSYNVAGPIWPLSGLGARVAGTVGEGGFLRLGVYDGLIEDTRQNRRGWRQNVSSDGGVLAITELGSSWSTDGRPGSWTLGAWWHSGLFTDFRDDSETKRTNGYHLMLEEALTQEGKWNAFARVGYSPRSERSFIELHTDVGFTATGLLPGRTEDTFGLAYFRSRFGNEYVAARRGAGDEVTSSEAGIELTYSFQVARGLWVQPDFQYIFSPHESARDAKVAILRVYAEF